MISKKKFKKHVLNTVGFIFPTALHQIINRDKSIQAHLNGKDLITYFILAGTFRRKALFPYGWYSNYEFLALSYDKIGI